MRRGTTPTLKLALEDIDPEEIRSLEIATIVCVKGGN